MSLEEERDALFSTTREEGMKKGPRVPEKIHKRRGECTFF
jgi:hypothetical protein